MESLAIKSSRGTYVVSFKETIADLVRELKGRTNVVFVIDQVVADLYASAFGELLESRPWIAIRATESEKTLSGCEKILSCLVANGGNRETQVIAIGGGIIQDLVTLSAHIYFRGIAWTYVPTTLLAMADSCIGAKASINFKTYKNQLGVFHSPAEVLICTGFLATLPEGELRSGYGEVYKLHFASSPAAFASLDFQVDKGGWLNPSIGRIIRSSLAIKQGYIEVDEFDAGIRRHLNYGHTFGHALESISDHKIPHGLAVAWGMDLINYLALKFGRTDEQLFNSTHAVLKRRFHWNLGFGISVSSLLEATKRDKKATGGRLTLVMPAATGSLEIVRQDYSKELEAHIEFYTSTLSIVT